MLVINICEKKQCPQKAFHHKTSFRSALSRQILQCRNSHFPKKINSHLCSLLSARAPGLISLSPTIPLTVNPPFFLPRISSCPHNFPSLRTLIFFWVSDSSFEIPCSSLLVCSSFGGRGMGRRRGSGGDLTFNGGSSGGW